MAIDSLRDGFVRLCFDPSANVLGKKCRLVLEGQYLNAGSAIADELVKVTAERDIDTMFGAGSVLAESLKVAIACCGNDAVEIFAVPRADAATGIAAEYEMTVTGSATSNGRIDIYWGNSNWNISVPIVSGDTPTQIGDDIVAALPADFPFTAVNAVGVITFTAVNKGTVGNFFNPIINWHGRNNYMPGGVSIATAQTVPGANDPVALDYNTVFGDCCVCCWALLSGDTTWQDGMHDWLTDQWSCDKPQCFGHGYTYNSGSLGQILSTDINSPVMSKMAHCDDDENFPYLKVAAYAALSCCLTVDNPELSIQGPNYGVLSCVSKPESCASCFTFDEQEQLREAGFVVTVPVSGGQGALTSPMVTNDITNRRYDDEGRENLTFRSVSSRRLASETAQRIAEQLQQFNGLGYYSKDTSIREGAKGVNQKMMLGTMRAWAKDQVGMLFSEFEDLDNDLTFSDDFELAPRCQGIPGKLYMNLTYRPPVRISQVVVNAAPKLLSNC